jgi:hypothetical protein
MKRVVVTCLCLGLAAGAVMALPQHTEMPKPGPEVQKMAWFIGDWKSEGEMKEGPWGPGGKMTGSDKCDWFEGGWQIVCNGRGKGPMGEMKTLGIGAYNPETKKYSWTMVDSTGMNSTAHGSVDGNTWRYEGVDVMGGQKIHSRYTMTVTGPTSYDFKWETSTDGSSWVTAATGKATKVLSK